MQEIKYELDFMKNQIQISGIYKLNHVTGILTGTITIDERENSIYYSWEIRDEHENILGSKSISIYFQQIPTEQDKFEFSRTHALEGIRTFRIGREKIVQEVNTK